MDYYIMLCSNIDNVATASIIIIQSFCPLELIMDLAKHGAKRLLWFVAEKLISDMIVWWVCGKEVA